MSFSPSQAGTVSRRIMDLRAEHLISAQEFVVLTWVLWTGRRPGRDRAQVAISTICKGCGARREDVVSALRKAQEFGLLVKVKAAGFIKGCWRNLVNTYIFTPIVPQSARRGPIERGFNSNRAPKPFIQARMRERAEAKHGPGERLEEALKRLAAVSGFAMPPTRPG